MWLAVKTTSLDYAMRAEAGFSLSLNLRVFQQYPPEGEVAGSKHVG
jgi:hypothetical protein